MIAKGTTHNSGSRLAAYMVTGKDGERAELYSLHGFAAGDIREAFASIEAMKAGTKLDKAFFHVQVRNPEGEELIRAQWLRVAEAIEHKIGYSGQPRAIAFHTDEKTGHEHMHVAWSRIDEETLQAKPLPFFKLRLKEVSRELEKELDLTRVSSERPRVELAPSRGEEEQSRRLDNDLHGIRGTIREAYERSDNGQAFAAALADQGLTLCQGERRDFIVLDQEGGIHALGKRLLGDSAAQVRQHMADLDRAALPTVEEGRDHLAREAPAITLPVIDQERQAIRESFAERAAEREAMQPAAEALASAAPAAARAAAHVERGLSGVAQVAQSIAGGVESVAIGLERFLFGGGEAAPAQPAPAPERKNEGQEVREHLGRMEPQVRATDPNVPRYRFGVDPELVAEMRRKREERERDDRDRGRERDDR